MQQPLGSDPAPPAYLRKIKPDGATIMASAGFAAYEWDLQSDRLVWDPHVAEVLPFDPSDIATGRGFAARLAQNAIRPRYDAVMRSGRIDAGDGVPYETVYEMQPRSGPAILVEDRGRWFAGLDGRPSNAHGVVRVLAGKQELEQGFLHRAKFDELTGEANRWSLMDRVATAAADAIRLERRCAFMLLAIDNLALINESLGFMHADEVIAAVAKRVRERLRGGDVLGRFSGNKFGLLLQNCKFEEMEVAARRLIGAVRENMIETSAGPVSATVTMAGVSVPRHGRTIREIVERAQDALATAKAKGPGSFAAYRPNIELERLRRKSLRATDEIVAALNERRFNLAFEPVVDASTLRISLMVSNDFTRW